MKHSDSVKELAAALAKAQGKMAGAKKDSANPAFNSRYADLASVVEAIKGPLAENGLSYVQMPVTNDKDEVGCETLLMHSSGEWIHAEPYYMPVAKANAHGFGSILTYARRYSLAAVCGIAPEDDDANAGVVDKPRQREVEPGPPRKMRAKDFQEHCAAISAATKMEPLQKAYTVAVLAARGIGDEDAVLAFQRKKDEAKEMIAVAHAAELASQP